MPRISLQAQKSHDDHSHLNHKSFNHSLQPSSLLLWLLAQVQLMQAHLWHSWRWILLMLPPKTHMKDFNDWCDPGSLELLCTNALSVFLRMCLKEGAFNEVFHTHSRVPWYWRRCFFFSNKDRLNPRTQSWHFKLRTWKKATKIPATISKTRTRSNKWFVKTGKYNVICNCSPFPCQDTEKHLAASPEVVPSGSKAGYFSLDWKYHMLPWYPVPQQLDVRLIHFGVSTYSPATWKKYKLQSQLPKCLLYQSRVTTTTLEVKTVQKFNIIGFQTKWWSSIDGISNN